jgi:hypothetical protein
MKYLLLLSALILTLVPCIASAETTIGVSTLSYNQDCLVARQAGLVTLYVIQMSSPGTTAVRFRLETSPGFPATLLSISAPNGILSGDSFGGITVTYGSCLYTTVTVLELHYMFTGNEPNCSYVRTGAHALSVDGKLDAYDCNGVRFAADWRGTHVQDSFPAPGGYPLTLCADILGVGHTGYGCKPDWGAVANEPSTWGAVKSLYR